MVVVAFGLAMAALGSYLVTLGTGTQFGASGVFGLTLEPSQSEGLNPGMRLIIWLVLIGVWALASVRVLRPSPEKTEPR